MPSTRPPSERTCTECGGRYSVMVGKIEHRFECSQYPAHIREFVERERARREQNVGVGKQVIREDVGARPSPASTTPTSSSGVETKRAAAAGQPAVVRPEARVWSLPDWQRIDERARRDYELVEDDPHAACICDACSPDALYRGRSIDRLSDEIEVDRERTNRRYA